MRVHGIKLANFRQFGGEQRLDFRSTIQRPVTIVFGANGSGKTTLLNAFTWALYGTMSEDIEQRERLITDSVWQALPIGGTAEVAVELSFDHEGHDYRLRRRAQVHKQSEEQRSPLAQVELWETMTDGSSKSIGAPQERILSILPQGISRFFFFNGERIEKLVQRGAYAEVKDDIKALLDLEQVERAIDHLPKVDRRLTADIKKYGGASASAIQTRIDQREEEETAQREQVAILDVELATLREERERVTELLRAHAGAAPIQRQRDSTAKELETARLSRDQASQERAVLVATKGFLAFTDHLVVESATMAAALYQKGTLPAPLKREFVDRLLSEDRCICGTPLLDPSDAREHVQGWRERAGLEAVEAAWQRLSGQMTPMEGERRHFCESLQVVVKRIATEREHVTRLEEEKSELDGRLKDSRLEDVQQLESRRLGLDERIGAKQEQIGAIRAGLEHTHRLAEQLASELARAEVTDELAAKARTRSNLVQVVRRALEEILEIRSEDMRNRLDGELKAIFGKITTKEYVPRLSESFELTLFQDVGGTELVVPKSTGENQILSLSFVAAVSKLARDISKDRRAEGDLPRDAGTYPIVMDAAFGSLDQNYQREVSRAIPQIAPQVIVLVSKSQGLGQVVTELMPYVSHVAVLVQHTTSGRDVGDDIELDGISYPYIQASADTDHTTFEVVK